MNFEFNGDKIYWHKATSVSNSETFSICTDKFPAVLDESSGAKIFNIGYVIESLKKCSIHLYLNLVSCLSNNPFHAYLIFISIFEKLPDSIMLLDIVKIKNIWDLGI